MAKLSSTVAIMVQPTGRSHLSLQAAVNSAAGSSVISASRNHLPTYGVREGSGWFSCLSTELSAAVKASNHLDLRPRGPATSAACHPRQVACCPAAAASPRQRMLMQAALVLPTPQHQSETCKKWTWMEKKLLVRCRKN